MKTLIAKTDEKVVADQNSDAEITVMTHNGVSHADEVVAVAAKALASGKKLRVVRTRNPILLEKGKLDPSTIVVDVGGVYDPDQGNFDHHQGPVIVGWRQMASAGLVWAADGASVVAKVLSQEYWDVDEGDAGSVMVASVAKRVDEAFIRHIDNADLGLSSPDGLSFSRVISGLNPTWVDLRGCSGEGRFLLQDARFEEALALATKALKAAILSAYAEEEAVATVDAAIADMTSAPEGSRQVLRLKSFAPWQEGVCRAVANGVWIEAVSWQDDNGLHMVQVVPVEARSFESDIRFPEKLSGLRGAELVEATGLASAEFVHPGGFIGGVKDPGEVQAFADLLVEKEA